MATPARTRAKRFARVRMAARALASLAATVAAMASAPVGAASFTAVDDSGRAVRFERPAARVVALAPSLTELVYAAGGGAALVGTTALSDFPPDARRIARIGDAARLDVERVLALRPDLVLVWQRGAHSRELAQLEAAGVTLFQLEPRRLDAVPDAVERLGALLGHDDEARRAAADLRHRLDRLRAAHAASAPVSVFYQVWRQPLMTVNGQHLIDDVIRLCGGRNVFADAPVLVPVLSLEAVVAADPQVLLTASESGGNSAWRRAPDDPAFAEWRRHTGLVAVRAGTMYALDGDAISRQGPRIVDGAQAVCAALDDARRSLR
jgi:iron complex transport system substrate-binding protein